VEIAARIWTPGYPGICDGRLCLPKISSAQVRRRGVDLVQLRREDTARNLGHGWSGVRVSAYSVNFSAASTSVFARSTARSRGGFLVAA
jgi:hypothetical protein